MKTTTGYTVNVGNIGNIRCETLREANATYNDYVLQSTTGRGSAEGEDIVLLTDEGDILKEYFGTLNHYNEE